MKPTRLPFFRTAPRSAKDAPAVIALPDARAQREAIGAGDARSRPPEYGSREYYQKAAAGSRIPFASTLQSILPRAYRKRIAILLTAIAVPAMAAPGDFGALAGSAPTEAEMVNARLAQQLAENPAMSFERPGQSFPGSAFFYLADPEPSEALVALPTTDALDIGAAEADRELGELIETGPAANPFFSGSGLNAQRANDCLAQAIWYEAASESEAGQRAVAQVVLNRVSHPNWPGSVCGVVYQGSNRSTGCQFSFTCDGSLRRRAQGASWARAKRIAGDALSGSVYKPVGHATHYHTLWVNPYWASSLDHVGTIGAHRFYRNRGSAGQKSAFTGRYAGVEPGAAQRVTPGPAPINASASLPDLPVARSAPSNPNRVRRSTGAARNISAPIIEPVLADPSLTASGQAREQYANAGQWKSDAARAALQSAQAQSQSEPIEDLEAP